MPGEDDLDAADLPDEARAAYALVLKSGSVPVTAQLPGLQQLADLGLLELSEDGEELLPVDPRQIELQLTSDWRRRAWQLELRAATLERDIGSLTAEFIAANGVRRDSIRYVHGLRAIGDFVDLSSRSAQREILTAQPGGGRPAEVLKAALPLALELLARGVRLCTLYQHSARFSEPTKEYVREVAAHGGEVRTLDEFFERIFLIDRSLAILPATVDRTVAVAVTDEAVVRFLADVFERNWQRALKFTPARAATSAKEVVPDIHAMIKRLLKEGMTDSAIAKRIGVSERTYHTHLARIRDALGAVSRVQLGYMLAREELQNTPWPGTAPEAAPEAAGAAGEVTGGGDGDGGSAAPPDREQG
jgi:hypothetical protein